MRKILTLTTLILCALSIYAQNTFYKNNYLYAHTFENGLNDGLYRNSATEDCITFIGLTSPSVGGPDPKVPVMQIESTGTINTDDSFDGGLNARCFPQTSTTEVTPSGCGTTSGNFINNLGLTFKFSADSEPTIGGIYLEAGQVNMSGLFQLNSNAGYRIVIHEGDICGSILYVSNTLNNTDLWNRFYVPFDGIDTKDWAGKIITFEIRYWNNNEGHPFFRFDDIALIGQTFCDRGIGKIGNLIWEDTNADGIKDSGESGIANVSVKLIADDGDGIYEPNDDDGVFGVKTTDANGNYLFENIPDGNYFICIPEDQFNQFNSLDKYFPSPVVGVSSNTDTDNQHHGIMDIAYKVNGVISDVLTITAGTEPTADGDDNNGNLTMDFGFYKPPTLSIGDVVWADVNIDNGIYTNGVDIPFKDVKLELYQDTDASGDYSSSDILLDKTITNASGNYRFTGVLPGDYIVVIPACNFDLDRGVLGESVLSTGLTPTDPDDNTNNDNEGVYSGLDVVSGVLTVAIGAEPTNDGDTDNNTNLTVDFGFFPCRLDATVVWDKTFGGDQTEYADEIIETSDGGYIIAGKSNSDISGNKTENTNGGFDIWVIKLDSDRNIVWQNTIGGPGSEQEIALIETSDGGYAFVCDSSSDMGGDKSENKRGSTDYWVVKLDANGNKVWDKTYGGDKFDNPYDIIQTSDGGYAIIGDSNSSLGDDKSEAPRGCCGDLDMWVVKLDASGNKTWDKTIGGTDWDYGNSILQTPDGGYILAGMSRSDTSGDKSEDSKGSFDYWIVKINSTGTKIWDKTIGGSNGEILFDLLATSDGGYLISGRSQSFLSGDKTEHRSGNNDNWIVKIDASGTILWDNTIGGNDRDGFETYDIHPITAKETSDNKYIIGGTSLSPKSGDKTENSIGGYDIWMVALENDGTVIWDKTLGGSNASIFRNMNLSSDGNILIASYTSSDMSGYKSENSYGSNDYWILKLRPPFENNCTENGLLSLGDLVWEDTNNDGTKDSSEDGIENVEVHLYADNGDGIYNSSDDIFIKRAFTNGNGNYLFENLSPEDYFVKIASENFYGGVGYLNGLCNSTGSVSGNSDLNNQDHGTDTQQAGQFGVISSIITLTENGEPINDGDTDSNSNLSIDFGFFAPPSIMKIGNLVWEDLNNNSFRDAGEPVLSGVTVELYQDKDGDELLDINKDNLIDDRTTDGLGVYCFENLSPGKYFVNIPASNWSGVLSGMKNSTAFGGNDFDMDNDDAGVEEMHYDEENQGVASSVLTLEYNAEPDVAIDGDDKNSNKTVDFGFYKEVKIGDFVWEDVDMDGIKAVTGENPIQDVRVDLFVDTDKNGIFDKNLDAFYWSAFTDVDGKYCFDRLGEDDYFVRISPTNFEADAVLEDKCASPVSFTGNSNENDRNHGVDYDEIRMEGIRSSIVTLTHGAEPNTAIDGDDANSNKTIDFGVMTSRICGMAFHDVNENGIYDIATDIVLERVLVLLKDAATDDIIDQAFTQADGTYTLIAKAGTYYLHFVEAKNTLDIVFGSGTNINATSSDLTDVGDSDIDPFTKMTVDFTFATGDSDCDIDAGFRINVLPVELSFFKGFKKDCGAHLEWVTLSEENNSHFIIEKSINASDFEQIGRVEGAGHSTETISYTYYDDRLQDELNYYRLKQVDFDGSYAYSEIELIKISKDSPCLNPLGSALVFPNPTKGNFYFEIELEKEMGEVNFTIVDVLGKTIKSQTNNLIEGQNRITFNSDDLPSGNYILNVKNNSYRITIIKD